MTARQTDNYMRVCMNTWLLCEACTHAEKEMPLPDERLIKSCMECAQSCIALVAHIIHDPQADQKYIFDCFLYCRECYNECMQHPKADIIYCGEACNQCADTIKELLFFNCN